MGRCVARRSAAGLAEGSRLNGRRILVLAPHPDDEVVGAAAAIGRARRAGAQVFVLPLTTGVPARAVLWPWQRGGHGARVARRRHEAAAVAAAIGAVLAGFGARASRTLGDDLIAARQQVVDAVQQLEIDRLWVPAWEGGHQDHDATNALGASVRALVEVWEFAEYNFSGGRIGTNRFPRDRGDEIVLELDPAERAAKRALLELYRSERGNLGYVGVERECFRRLIAPDYSRPPHDGPLFYQRFQWVPFRHPRIDFTDPREVCRKLAAFPGTGLGQVPASR